MFCNLCLLVYFFCQKEEIAGTGGSLGEGLQIGTLKEGSQPAGEPIQLLWNHGKNSQFPAIHWMGGQNTDKTTKVHRSRGDGI